MVRFGLLGTGHWAAETQGTALAASAEADLVGVWGRDPVKADEVGRRFGVRAYRDVDDLIADVDAVAVALPPDVQGELAARAAEAGRHLLLDKPLALSTAAADRIVTAVRERRLASIVFFTARFNANVEQFIGETAAAGGWYAARAMLYASIFQPGSPYGGSPWRRAKGGLWDVGPHVLSVVLPVLGPVERVSAVGGPRDITHMLLAHHGGATSTLSLAVDAAPAATARETAFYGENGIAVLPNGDSSAVAAFTEAIRQLTRAVTDRTPDHPCDVRFGREVVAVLEAAQTARDSGATATVMPSLGAGVPAHPGNVGSTC